MISKRGPKNHLQSKYNHSVPLEYAFIADRLATLCHDVITSTVTTPI